MRGNAGAIVLAALALPGVWLVPAPAQAQAAPEKGSLAFKYQHYQDSQPGLRRITANSPSLYALVPVGPYWAVEGTLAIDTLSGATPRWQSAVSSASGMREERKAGEIKVTRYLGRSAYSAGLSHSTERDLASTALALQGKWSSADNITTWNIGVASSEDSITPTNGGLRNVSKENKHADELLVGLAQAVSSDDLLEVNLTLNAGKGFYNDPYKLFDVRPEARKQAALLGRWNHRLAGDGSTLRSSYRFYRDSFGVRTHTAQLEWAKRAGERLVLTPLLRYDRQSAAWFYAVPVLDDAGQIVLPTLAPTGFSSGDSRLSAFGAVTLGLKADFKLSEDWAVEGKWEAYGQRAAWRLGGQGTQGLAPFRATTVQLGARYRF